MVMMSGIIFFFQAEDGIRDIGVTGVQTCALPIWSRRRWTPQSGYQLQVLAARALILSRKFGWCIGLLEVSPHAQAHADEEVAGDQGHHRPEDRLDPHRRLEGQGSEREEEDQAYRGERRRHRRREQHEYQAQAPRRPHPALLSRTLDAPSPIA